MSQRDPFQTRTAEAPTPSPRTTSSAPANGSSPARTEVLGSSKTKKPDDRYPSTHALLDALHSLSVPASA